MSLNPKSLTRYECWNFKGGGGGRGSEGPLSRKKKRKWKCIGYISWYLRTKLFNIFIEKLKPSPVCCKDHVQFPKLTQCVCNMLYNHYWPCKVVLRSGWIVTQELPENELIIGSGNCSHCIIQWNAQNGGNLMSWFCDLQVYF